MEICKHCGESVPEGFERCGYCGEPLSELSRPQPEIRRTVTIVTSDLLGSTALGEKLDPETLREILTLYFDEMRSVLESYGGTIEKIIGDAIVAVFGLPLERDDDALRAVMAAAETQSASAVLNEQLHRRWGVRLTTRTGIATGEVLVGAASAGEHILTGDVVKLANRLEQAAPPGEVLIGQPTYQLVSESVDTEPAEPVVPKGSTQAVPAYRLVAIRAGAAADTRRVTSGEHPSASVCSNCGTENPLDFRRCGSCGALLATRHVRETRKTVTIVFSDLKATTLDGEGLAPSALRDVMGRAFDESRQALARHGGTVEKFIGDAVMAVFGLPVRHEDDALRAVRSAFEMRRGLTALAETLAGEGVGLEFNIGVNTGEVVAGEASLGQRLVTGDAVNVAARLEQSATSHEVLIGHPTQALVRDFVEVQEVEPLTVKGKAQPLRAYRLLGLQSARVAARPGAAMVGREEELATLASTFSTVVNERTCRMVTVVGDAGVGKTRLTSEFLASIEAEARIVRGRCLPYGDGITFWPIVEAAREAAAILETDHPDEALEKLGAIIGDDDVVQRVGAAIGLVEAPFQVAELVWGIRRFFEILADEGPVAVVFDDIQWAESTFLELIGTLTEAYAGAGDAPLHVSSGAPGEATRMGGGPERATHRSRCRYPMRTPARSSRTSWGRRDWTPPCSPGCVAAAEGNPLFVEQLISMLIDSGLLASTEGRWELLGDMSEISIPPTIHALLAARLDRLSEPERGVIDPASVIGLQFAQAALEAIVEDPLQGEVDARLGTLITKQLVRRQEQVEGEAGGYRFEHLMIRDATYAGLLKRTRAQLHEAFVAWADEANRATDRATEFEEILGYHLEQAYRYWVELGPLDEHGLATGIDAAERLASSGRRAVARGDMPAAANLLERAASLLPQDDERRPRILIDLGYARFELGTYAAAETALEDAIVGAAARKDEAQEMTARLELLLQRFLTDPAKIEGRVEDQITRQSPSSNAPAKRMAWRARQCSWPTCASWRASGTRPRSDREVIVHARKLGDRVREIRAAPLLAQFARSARRRSRRRSRSPRRCSTAPAASGNQRRSCFARLPTSTPCRGVRRRLATSIGGRAPCSRNSGWTFQAALTSLDSGPIEMLAGDPVAAEAELRRDYETLDRLGERNYITTVAVYLAEALYRQGRYADADTFASSAPRSLLPTT